MPKMAFHLLTICVTIISVTDPNITLQDKPIYLDLISVAIVMLGQL